MKLKGTRDARAVHLVVLQHGLWGRPDDVARLAAFLQAAFHAADAQQQLQDRIVVLNSTCNARVLTYDGIDVCGARLAKLVQETVEEQQQEGARVIKLSLIGYSLGGLICRYAAGKLHVAGLFEEVQPANLITIATPHLGSFKEPTTWMARFFNVNVPLVASRTGMQLVLADADYSVPWLVHQQQLHNQAHQQRQQQQQHGQQRQQQGVVKQQHAAAAAGVSTDSNHHQQQHQQQEGTSKADDGAAAASQQQPGGSSGRQQQQQQQQQQQPISLPPGVDPSQPVPLLLLMAHPAGPFHQALAAFKTRICCANIRHDTTVPYCTAGICTANPYEQRPPVSVNPQLYPSVVQPAGEGEQHAAFPDAKGRSRMLLFLLFLPLFPLFYGYSVSKGLLHHREARKRPVDVAWLQQYQAAAEALGAGLNPFSRQASRQLQERLEQQQEQQQQQQQQQHQQQKQQHVPRAGEGGSSAAVVTPVLSSALAPSPFAAAAEGRGSSSSRPGVPTNRGLQQLLSGSGSSSGRPQHGMGLHTQVDSGATGQAASQVDGDAGDAAEDEPHSAAAAAEQTEEQVLRASGGSALLLTPQASRRLTAAGSLHEHEGIVEANDSSGDAWLVQQQQRWMARQLFDEMPPCAVCERCWSVQGAGVPCGGCECDSGAGAGDAGSAADADERQQLVGAAKPEAAAAADAAVHVQSSSGNAGAKDAAPADGRSSGGVGLSEGGWHRVDVWTGHVHAHATIIVRDKRYESQSRDLFAYLVNHMSL